MDRKPIGIKNYGTIPHLEGSRVTPADKHCHEGQTRIATAKARDRHDDVILTEKLDGSNVGVVLLNGDIIPITRAGYRADTSPYEQHWHYADWVKTNESRFRYVLEEGERVCGEWLMQAHGTLYKLHHEPFAIFDLMKAHKRMPYDDMLRRIARGCFTTPKLLHRGPPVNIPRALELLGEYGSHGADRAEGCVWKIQRRGEVDFLVKFIHPDKTDGVYLMDELGKQKPPKWNWYPTPHAASLHPTTLKEK